MSKEKKLTGYPSIDKPWLQYYSKDAINAPLPECSIYEYIWENNKDHLDDVALVFCDRNITYRDLFENIEHIAQVLLTSGISKSDIVTVCIPNTPEAVYIFYGLNILGATCNLVDPRASKAVMIEHLKLAESKLLITIPECYQLFNDIREEVGLKKIVVVDVLHTINPSIKHSLLGDNDTEWKDFIEIDNNIDITKENYDCDAPICILHTGGTTGTPKGAVLTNKNFHSLVIQWKYLGLYYNRNSSLLSLMPPFASFGLTANLHVPLSFGMKIILIPEYNPSKIVEQIKRYKPNCVPASPAHWEAVCHDKEAKNMDFSFLRVAFVGGDTLNSKIEEGLNDLFAKSNKNLKMRKGYGMTETTTGISMTAFDSTNLEGSVGIPLPKTTVAIVNEEDKELQYGQVGEICVQSDNVMMGYYNMSSETNTVMRIHSDGKVWFHSGDLGYFTEDGILYIKGRLKRIIIRHDGIKIYPVDVESKLSECPIVKSCAVVGMQDPQHLQGCIPVAYIVLKDNITDFNHSKKMLEDYCNENVIDYAVPQMYKFVGDLPYTKNGKIDFRLLEQQGDKFVEKLNQNH